MLYSQKKIQTKREVESLSDSRVTISAPEKKAENDPLKSLRFQAGVGVLLISL